MLPTFFVVDLYDVQVRLEIGIVTLDPARISIGFDHGITRLVTHRDGVDVGVRGHFRTTVQAQQCDDKRQEDLSH